MIDTRGDRATLTFDQRLLLEDEVLPRARKWLGIPGLSDHGRKTLAFWGENDGRQEAAE